MIRDRQLLLPVNPGFVVMTLTLSFMLDMALTSWWLGNAAWRPDLTALTLAFWIIHQPTRVGIGWAFMLGLLMDVHESALLGQHALSYTVMAYLAVMMHRRVLWFSLRAQMLQVFPLFVVAWLIQLVIRMGMGLSFPGFSHLLAPILQALAWPLVCEMLLAPQRRAPDPDENRPL
ncbi:MAG: rod shape-determining protein MreD [Pseudomonadota bacterium]|jgi:rod shape-determining protein MreD